MPLTHRPVIPTPPVYVPGFGLMPTNAWLSMPTTHLFDNVISIYRRLVINPVVERSASGTSYFDISYAQAFFFIRTSSSTSDPSQLRLWRFYFYHFLESQGGRTLLSVDSYIFPHWPDIEVEGTTITGHSNVVTEVWGGFSSTQNMRAAEWRYFGAMRNDREYRLKPKAGSPSPVYVPSPIVNVFQNKVFSIGGRIYSPTDIQDPLNPWKVEDFNDNSLLYSNAGEAGVLGGYVRLPPAEQGRDLFGDGRVLYVSTTAGIRAYVGDFFNNLESFDVDAPLQKANTNVADGKGVGMYISNNNQVISISGGKSQTVYDMSYCGGGGGAPTDVLAQDGMIVAGSIPDEDGSTNMIIYANEHHVEHIVPDLPSVTTNYIPSFTPSSTTYSYAQIDLYHADVYAAYQGLPVARFVEANVFAGGGSSRSHVSCSRSYRYNTSIVGIIFVDNITGISGAPQDVQVNVRCVAANGSISILPATINSPYVFYSGSLMYSADYSTELPIITYTASPNPGVSKVIPVGHQNNCVAINIEPHRAIAIAPLGASISVVVVYANGSCQIF